MYGADTWEAFGFGLIAIWVHKFVLGTFVDKKKD